MNRSEGVDTGLMIAAATMLGVSAFWDLAGASAQEGLAADPQVQAPAQQPQGVYESEKAWKFKDDQLVFFNPSPNPGGIRYIRWKDFTWVVTPSQITVIDERPYGTQLQGQRGQLTEDGSQKDKDLMNDLKKQAGDIRRSRDPSSGEVPVSIGIGFGFGFGGFGSCDHGGHGHHHR